MAHLKKTLVLSGSLLLASIVVQFVFSATKDAPVPGKIDFNRDVRPILSDNCFFCHGPDKNKRKAELRLDTKEGLFTERKGRIPAVPGKLDKSEIWRRIVTTDADDLMPPPESHKTLSPRDKDILKKWIEQGVDFKGHWAYEPLTRPAVPKAENKNFVVNDVDRFVLDRFKREGLKASPPADRATLIRRLALDLTGVPPTWDQVQAFISDTRPDAYERLVDSLLASPHYGERMAMYWLDLVRYADTVGYHGDRPQAAYPYRDYVIRAFNENTPFDRFTLEQLAGDLLPNSTLTQRVAAGYNRLNMMSEEGGVQDKEYLLRYAADRVRNLGSVFLGSTTACCECHDHKFDPLLTKDFYRLAAFFADIKEHGYYGGKNDDKGNWGESLQVPTEKQSTELKQLDADLAAAQVALNTQTPQLDAALAEWEKTTVPTEWAPLTLVEAKSAGGAVLKPLDDGSILATGPSPDRDAYTLVYTTSLKGITAFRLEALPDDSLGQKGPGRAGNFVLNSIELKAGESPVQLVAPTATFEQANWGIAGAVDADDASGWAVMPEFGKPHTAIFQTAADLGDGSASTLTFKLRQNFGSYHVLGRFRISATTHARPNTAKGMSENIRAILVVAPDQRTAEQKNTLAAHFRSFTPLLAEPRAKLNAALQRKNQLIAEIPTTLATVAVEPKMVRILPRGNWMDESGEVVQPGVPSFLPQIKKEGRATRHDLALWLTSADNPLTARVMANHFWKIAFGQGLSRSVSDFGAQGEAPSHPELLDWLAVEFRDSGWDVKRAMKMIVMSSTYRQSSLTTPDLQERDPFNRLLARQSRYRLDAEMVRDSALLISGLLADEIGGPSAKPYQPAGYYSFLNFPVREYQADKGAGLYRRGVYTWWQRQYLHPSLLAFDAPSREECSAQRNRSNIPQQALVLLNDPSYVEASRAFAARIIQKGGATLDERLDYAFQQALFRKPTARERQLLTALHNEHAAQFATDETASRELIAVGDTPAPADIKPAELATWTSISRVVLNLYETISRN